LWRIDAVWGGAAKLNRQDRDAQMTRFHLLAIATAVLVAGSSLLAQADSHRAPRCEWSSKSEAKATRRFLDYLWLPINSFPSVEIWNGCFRVMYVSEGRWVMEYYDPDTKRRIY
jgi:hypothetical protein